MHKNVIVVGAGISGIAAGYNLKKSCPNKSFAILEGRESLGGTWDLFKYPGIRSDSDMHTLGYRFKPWIHDKSIADGPSILEYLNETVDENNLKKDILLNHKVKSANWNSDKSLWELEINNKDQLVNMTCDFLFLCGGYFSYSKPHMPSFINQEKFEGQIIHPQFWNDQLDYINKKVVVIGSGATAITLVPAIAEKAKHVVMLQRSPSYVVSRPSEDAINRFLRKFLPIKFTYFLIRWKNILWQSYTFFLARKFPERIKKGILDLLKDELGSDFDIKKHFTPSYKPWDQRMCLVPDSDLFSAIKNNDKVGLILFSDEILKYIPPKKGRSHVLRLITDLVNHDYDKKQSQTSIKNDLEFASKISRRKNVMFVISDFMDDNFWTERVRCE